MSDAIKKCNAEETAACCCVDVGAVIDNSDCLATYSRFFSNKTEAENMLSELTSKARAVESDPCVIDSQLTPVDDGVRLDIDFIFSCQAEAMIFQLGLR